MHFARELLTCYSGYCYSVWNSNIALTANVNGADNGGNPTPSTSGLQPQGVAGTSWLNKSDSDSDCDSKFLIVKRKKKHYVVEDDSSELSEDFEKPVKRKYFKKYNVAKARKSISLRKNDKRKVGTIPVPEDDEPQSVEDSDIIVISSDNENDTGDNDNESYEECSINLEPLQPADEVLVCLPCGCNSACVAHGTEYVFKHNRCNECADPITGTDIVISAYRALFRKSMKM
ncbi:Homeobox protein aristaless [Frankliniella fusca]|uniref:Homeobox protein aristaless n=1 Tax=Frankliniella fusca TaxID=407009 RepID=A0AAE1LKT0_9NEOP|nr:Homeobox protein aristaless [Frankliniella fusca]